MPLLEQKSFVEIHWNSSGLTEMLQLKLLKFLTLLVGLRHLSHRNLYCFRKEWQGLKASTGIWRDSGTYTSAALHSRAKAWVSLETLGPLGCPGQVGALWPWLPRVEPLGWEGSAGNLAPWEPGCPGSIHRSLCSHLQMAEPGCWSWKQLHKLCWSIPGKKMNFLIFKTSQTTTSALKSEEMIQEPRSFLSCPGNLEDSQSGELWSLCIQLTLLSWQLEKKQKHHFLSHHGTSVNNFSFQSSSSFDILEQWLL